MEKTISIRNADITFSIWDLGGIFLLFFKLGQREFINMLPLVCNDSIALLFMFDLSRKSTLNSVKEWFFYKFILRYRQARGFNRVFIKYINFKDCNTFFNWVFNLYN